MGTVHLTQGHHGLYIRSPGTDPNMRILLTPELLARPIYNQVGKIANELTHGVVRGALQALLDLPNFDAAVSFCVVKRDDVPHIVLPHREWSEITFASPENVVVKFSHDSRKDNRAFYHLLEWLEEEYPDGELSEEDFDQFVRAWSSVSRWRSFFESRIRRQIECERSESESLRAKAEDIAVRARTLEAALES
ncbi:hypothetical protein BH11PAT2_BH11PAT2_06920 [soil metagenome]